MKRVLVVFDSMYGNTERIAHAIAQGMSPEASASVLHIRDLNPEEVSDVDLLVVGSPTQGFRPTRVAAQALKRLAAQRTKGLRAAAFDTRFGEVRLRSGPLRLLVKAGGFAAPHIARALTKAGASLVAGPEGFFVEDTEGPLQPGEIDRAAAWGKSLLAAVK